MVNVVGIRFKKAGKIYYFDPDNLSIEDGANVIVETARGIEFGTIVVLNREIAEDEIVSPLKKVIRIATAEDKNMYQENKKSEKRAFDICLQKIQYHKLNMKLIDVEFTFDNSKILFYFTADGRVDFRELVKDLASVFKTRIELRQIGVRDECKMTGGLGACGRELCCGNFLGDFQPVSIKMAKEQNLSLNPTKISGVCGRLMCCLKYEQETYEELLKYMPGIEAVVETPTGKGIVIGTSVLKGRVRVKVEKGDHTEINDFDINDIKIIKNVRREDEASEIEVLKQLED